MYKGTIIKKEGCEFGGKERKQYILVRPEWHTEKRHARKPHLLHLAKLSDDRTCTCVKVEIQGGGNKSEGDQSDSP